MTRIVTALLCLPAFAAPAQAAPQPYGANNVPGFRNVLPPGSKGVDNVDDLAAFTGAGTYPEHWTDQQPLYDNLIYASPTLTHDQIGDYFKDATFGMQAGAQDRLYLMDVLRHTGRAQLSSFAAARVNPALMPAEYAAFGMTSVDPWKGTDVIATASLIGGIFGKGGGRELDSAQTLQAFTKRLGRKRGRRSWRDFRRKEDPEAPTTVDRQRFPYQTRSAFAKRGLAMPDRGSVQETPVGGPVPPDPEDTRSVGTQLLRAATQPPHASNWEMVSAAESTNGHPIGVLGPQVGYYVPQILLEEDLHGGGIDARGASFPGVNLIVQLGHGTDYAWSARAATRPPARTR